MSRLEKFTQSARRVLMLAHMEAERMLKPAIGSEHIFLGLLQEDAGVAGRVLRDLGVELERAREMILRISGKGAKKESKINLAPDAFAILVQRRRTDDLQFPTGESGLEYIGRIYR